MDREELIRRVHELDFPLGSYCVVGTGPMVVRMLCEGRDIDILVSEELYTDLRAKDGWEEAPHHEGRLLLSNPPFEVGTEYGYGEYWPEPQTLFTQADVVEGIAFAPLEDIAAFKRARMQQKDQSDLALIGEYLYEHPDDDVLL